MESNVKELLDLVLRWMHLIAGIMWVGNSMLFNWLDRNLLKPGDDGYVGGTNTKKELLDGEIWMVHSGGFYQIEKKRLEPGEMPRVLHWFKWQSYTTWMTGISLLVLVYYVGGGFMVDPQVRALSHPTAVAIGVGTLLGGFITYDLIWRSPLAKSETVATVVSFGLLAGVVFFLHQFLSGRAAYIHVGALMGTLMAGNVFFHIIPSQHSLVDATKHGKPQDKLIGLHAKQRSIHNNYLTFPVLFIMLSNHFPSTYGSKLNYVILGVVMVGGASVRHFLNIRFTFKPWIWGFAGVFGGTVVLLFVLLSQRSAAAPVKQDLGAPVDFKVVQSVIRQRCAVCHSETPSDPVWKVAPNNVKFDTPAEIKAHADRIHARAYVSRTMPLNNQTGITEEERDLIGRWVLQGAHTE
ncbi:MAG: urate hydroxylase PuuD [Polyangiaceae bacterium]